MDVDALTDEQLRDAVMRLRGITDPAALDPAVVGEVMGLVAALEVIVSLPATPARYPPASRAVWTDSMAGSRSTTRAPCGR